ncbi:MAG: NAD(+)/NADH kinase [Sedimentisphaerales bacterium]|jgi:NAD+ kinase|nr:NAD(+)/NADH kinase [Sedimentisphaerales bacterium]
MAPSRPKVAVFGDPNRPSVPQAIGRFCRFAKDKATLMVLERPLEDHLPRLRDCALAVVFGGDGTIIAAARILSKAYIPIAGINLGKLGYLAEFSLQELKLAFDQILKGQIRAERRMMLACKVRSAGAGHVRFEARAINDVFVAAGPPYRVIELQLSVDGQDVARCVSDGLIVASPTGSTAYNLSAGGPILPGRMKAMVVTAICPHSLSFRPIVIEADRTIEIRPVRLNEGTTLSVDGQLGCGLGHQDRIEVKRARCDFLFINNPFRDSWQTLATKLGWAGLPRYHQGAGHAR